MPLANTFGVCTCLGVGYPGLSPTLGWNWRTPSALSSVCSFVAYFAGRVFGAYFANGKFGSMSTGTLFNRSSAPCIGGLITAYLSSIALAVS